MSPAAPKSTTVTMDSRVLIGLITALLGIGAGGAGVGLAKPHQEAAPPVCGDVAATLKELNSNMAQLNTQMAVFAEKQAAMERWQDRHEAKEKQR